ncbi:hypothetical protein EJ02DRAFT_439472 [Clathrospora elynae]|uniref:Uncharacterized protein n=1 Tax=Clathrospora elynae TaxID=706981 RepID=A0A6A5S6G7_9PLEO|nr:hypothetical protein EJ02DRAFT_439472 [Clathrospora elynae]
MGAISSEIMENFLRFEVLPHCNPYPAPNSVIVLNNASIHRLLGVRALCVEAGRHENQATDVSQFSSSEVLKRLASSKSPLKQLAIFSTLTLSEKVSLKDFEYLTVLEIPQPGLLNIPLDELNAENIASLLREQIPITVLGLVLRFLTYDPQLKMVLEQLAQLKLEGVSPALKLASLTFY